MIIRTKSEIPSSDITPKHMVDEYRRARRGLLTGMAAMAASSLLPRAAWAATKLNAAVNGKYTQTDAVTPQQKAQSYNNFYEFGTDKSDPAANAHTLRVRPWTIRLEGLVKKPQTIDLDKIIAYRPLEQRVYRFRCVEGWSMVIPWDGYQLSELIKFADPLPSAKYVQFISLADKSQEQLPGGFPWPYSEGLRMDEAMHPLTMLTFGSYGETLANQQGAPVRIIVPWKYGFKNPKSIVAIRFVKDQPPTTWVELNAPAYGFYSNVNPDVAPWHDQSHERLLNSNSIFPKYVPTKMFNGYSEVAGLYSGMDLKKNY